MRGYKGMNADMTCRGMQYEIGKSYHVDGDIAVCTRGLHFCERLADVFEFYNADGFNIFCEVEASGKIVTNGSKSVASDLKIVRQLTDVEVNRTFYGDGYGNGCGDGYGYGDGNGYGNIQRVLVWEE